MTYSLKRIKKIRQSTEWRRSTLYRIYVKMFHSNLWTSPGWVGGITSARRKPPEANPDHKAALKMEKGCNTDVTRFWNFQCGAKQPTK